MNKRKQFSHRNDVWDADGGIIEQLAGIKDYFACIIYQAALQRWSDAAITLRRGAQVLLRAGQCTAPSENLGVAPGDVTQRSASTQACPHGADNLERAANGEHPEETQQAHRGQTKKWERKGEQEKHGSSRTLRVMPAPPPPVVYEGCPPSRSSDFLDAPNGCRPRRVEVMSPVRGRSSKPRAGRAPHLTRRGFAFDHAALPLRPLPGNAIGRGALNA